MTEPATSWLELLRRLGYLYLLLASGVAMGAIAGRLSPSRWHLAHHLGNFIFWIGGPFTILVFMHGANLSGWVWVAPLAAWVSMLVGLGLGWLWLKLYAPTQPPIVRTNAPEISWSKPTQGSFLLATMAGNTGYIGYPVVLALARHEHFAGALFYDLLGTAIGTYGLGVAIAAYWGGKAASARLLALQVLKNPPLWSFVLGFYLRDVDWHPQIAAGLQSLAWGIIFASLVLIGMRLSQLSAGQSWHKLVPSLVIKMLVVPLLLGMGLTLMGINGGPRLVLVLQAAMPPAFSTLVLSEVYDLDRDLSVTAVVIGATGLLFLLPLWVWLFSSF